MAAKGKPFEPGNKFGRGRPRGSRNKTALVAQQVLDEHAVPVVRKCLMMALQGDSKAMQLCMDRIVPARRELPVKIGRLAMGTARELSKASETVLKRVAAGELTVGQGQGVAELMEGRRRIIETQDIDQRLRLVEGGHES